MQEHCELLQRPTDISVGGQEKSLLALFFADNPLPSPLPRTGQLCSLGQGVVHTSWQGLCRAAAAAF